MLASRRKRFEKMALLPKLVNYWSLTKCAIDGNRIQLPLDGPEIQYDLEDLLKSSVKQQMMSSDMYSYWVHFFLAE